MMNLSFITDIAKWLCSFASSFTDRRTSPTEGFHTVHNIMTDNYAVNSVETPAISSTCSSENHAQKSDIIRKGYLLNTYPY